jgi:3-oxoacyl-[acyl-carrier protein] reductase
MRRRITAFAHPCDLGDRESVRVMIENLSERLGGIDVLVNNAGRIQVGPFDAMTDEDFRAELDVHMWDRSGRFARYCRRCGAADSAVS